MFHDSNLRNRYRVSNLIENFKISSTKIAHSPFPFLCIPLSVIAIFGKNFGFMCDLICNTLDYIILLWNFCLKIDF